MLLYYAGAHKTTKKKKNLHNYFYIMKNVEIYKKKKKKRERDERLEGKYDKRQKPSRLDNNKHKVCDIKSFSNIFFKNKKL